MKDMEFIAYVFYRALLIAISKMVAALQKR